MVCNAQLTKFNFITQIFMAASRAFCFLARWIISIHANRRDIAAVELTSAVVGLATHDTSTPVSSVLLVLLVVPLLDGGDELGELALVLGGDLGDREDGSGLDNIRLTVIPENKL